MILILNIWSNENQYLWKKNEFNPRAGGCSPFTVIADREPAAGEKNFQDRSWIGPEMVLNGSGPVLNGSGPVRMGQNGYGCVIIFI